MAIGGVCSCQEIERIIEEKFQELLGGLKIGGKGDRRRLPKEMTPRREFMSHCMRSPAKGGLGKSMAECAQGWKQQKQ
jgi:hypothetical protein